MGWIKTRPEPFLVNLTRLSNPKKSFFLIILPIFCYILPKTTGIIALEMRKKLDPSLIRVKFFQPETRLELNIKIQNQTRGQRFGPDPSLLLTHSLVLLLLACFSG